MASRGRVYAVFESASDARAALQRLADAGLGPADVEVRSSVPMHDVIPVGLELRTRVPLMSVLGGLLGGAGAFLLVSLTSLAYPLPTGGMAIVALPAAGVITFEGVAVGAILFTVAAVLYECRLPGRTRGAEPFAEHVAAGRIVVSVPGGSGAEAGWTAGAISTRTVESP